MIWTGVKKNETFFALGSVFGFFVVPPDGSGGGGMPREFFGRGTSLTWFGRLDNKISIRCLGSPGKRLMLFLERSQVIDQYDSLEAWMY